jgi:hypothetical protein
VNKVWFKWPENYFENRPNLVPWYTVMRRLTFLPIVLIGGSLLWIGVACAFGVEDAERIRKEIM